MEIMYDVIPFYSKKHDVNKLATWHNYNDEIQKQIDFLIKSKYRNWITSIANNNITSHRQSMQHRIIISTMQIKLKSNYYNFISEKLSKYGASDWTLPDLT